MKIIALFVLILALGACANTGTQPDKSAVVDVDSVPQGAVVYARDRAIGLTPMKVIVPLLDSGIAAGRATFPLTFRWVSGATLSQTITLTFRPGDTKVWTTRPTIVQRPPQTPNLAADIKMAADIRYAQQRAQSHDDSDGIGPGLSLLLGFAQGLGNAASNYRPSPTCISRVVGSSIYTSC